MTIALLFAAGICAGCGHREVSANSDAASVPTVAVAEVTARPVAQHLTLSSELVPYQEIDVYAKVAGYVRQLNVDYGSRVRKGEVMAVLEIPELQAQLDEDNAAIRAQSDQVTRAQHEIGRAKAEHDALHMQYDRLAGVAQTQKGLVAQQEVDDAHAKDLASESQLAAVEGAYQAAQSQLLQAKARLNRDQALYDYSRITAPFDGVVTQRYANLGALMQAGTTSTQATPLVRLSDESLYRLVIPVPESYVRYIRVGDPVEVRVPALNETVHGKVTTFSVDVSGSTRTMHTEVNIPNTDGKLVPGVYAEAVLTLNQRDNVPVVPLQAVARNGEKTSVDVVRPDGRVEERPITAGIQMPDYVEVTAGLAPGEKVIVSDRGGLKPGDLVKPQSAEPVQYESAQK